LKPAIFTKVSNLYLLNAPLPSIRKIFIFPKSFCLYSFYFVFIFVLCFISCLLQTFLESLDKIPAKDIEWQRDANGQVLQCLENFFKDMAGILFLYNKKNHFSGDVL